MNITVDEEDSKTRVVLRASQSKKLQSHLSGDHQHDQHSILEESEREI
jgi:hypothetical protein